MNDYDQILDILNVSHISEVMLLVVYYFHIKGLGPPVIFNNNHRLKTSSVLSDRYACSARTSPYSETCDRPPFLALATTYRPAKALFSFCE